MGFRWLVVWCSGLVLAAGCGSADVGDGTSSSSAPSTVVAADGPLVRFRGGAAQRSGGELRLCLRGDDTGCAMGPRLDGVTWDELPGESVEVSWGRYSAEPLVLEAVATTDGRAAVIRSVAVDDTPRIEVEPSTPCDPPAGGWPDPPLRQGQVGPVRTAIDRYAEAEPQVVSSRRRWDRATGVHTVPVTADVARHQAALDELLDAPTCVIQIDHSDAEREAAREQMRAASEVWSSRGYGSHGNHVEDDAIVVNIERIDPRFWADVADIGMPVRVVGAIEVLDGTVDDLPDESVWQLPAPRPEHLVITCNGRPVDPAVFDGPPDDHLDDHPSTVVLTELAGSEEDSVYAAEGSQWWRAYEDEHRVLYIATDGSTIGGRRDASGQWRWAGSSGGGGSGRPVAEPCEFRRVSGGLESAAWKAVETPTTADVVEVRVTEQACASGEEPGDRLLDPVVEESADQVVVTFFVRSQAGFAECPSNPSVGVTVQLDAPLGDRELFDGSYVPPVEPGRGYNAID